MNINKSIMSIIPKNKNWLSDNIASIIALSFIWYTFYVFKLVLLKEVKTSESQTITIINSITNILMLIVGYYFGSSKGSKDKEQKINELEEKKLDLTNKVGLFIIAVLLLSSCVSEKKRAQICNTCPIKDSIVFKETIKLKDTIIYIDQPGPIQYLENPCKILCDSLGNLKKFEIKKKENGITGTIKSVGNSIAFDCAADSLQAVIKGLQEKETFKSEKNNIVRYEDCKRDHRNGFDGFCKWYFFITAAFLLIRYGIKAIKKYFLK